MPLTGVNHQTNTTFFLYIRQQNQRQGVFIVMIDIIVGGQGGDEGKGDITRYLAEKGDYSFNFFGKSKDGYEGLSIKLHGPLEK